ncbi:MAG: DnaA regulatory inactivator Hda [Burkholderiales bacterium]|nr:DnaA regulatory inactivator Hda [Burkholderiales bacterium]
MKQLILDLIPPPLPTLDNFVPGRNGEALKALLDAASGNPSAKILYLWGTESSGKSHLMQSFPAVESAPEYFASHAGVLPDGPGYFVVDDVHSLTETHQAGIFNLINLINASQMHHVLIATGNAAPRDLAIRRDLASRLGQGLVFQLIPLSDDEKSDALRAHARSRGFALREEVIAYLLRHSRRDMANLIGLLDALDQHSLETGREITLPLLRELAQPTLV